MLQRENCLWATGKYDARVTAFDTCSIHNYTWTFITIGPTKKKREREGYEKEEQMTMVVASRDVRHTSFTIIIKPKIYNTYGDSFWRRHARESTQLANLFFTTTPRLEIALDLSNRIEAGEYC